MNLLVAEKEQSPVSRAKRLSLIFRLPILVETSCVATILFEIFFKCNGKGIQALKQNSKLGSLVVSQL